MKKRVVIIRVGDDLMVEFYLADGQVKARKWTVLSTTPERRAKPIENHEWNPSRTVFKGEELRRMPLY